MKQAFLLLLAIATLARGESAIELNNQGSAQFSQFHYREAEASFRQAIELSGDSARVSVHQRTVFYANLAAVYRAQARYGQAEECYRVSLRSAQVQGEVSQSALRGLALLYLAQSKLSQADRFARQALDAATSATPLDGRRISEAHNNLALILLEEGALPEARRVAQQALAEASPDEATAGNALNTLGRIALAHGNGPEAQQYLSTATQVLERALARHDPAIAAVWANLGHAESLCGNWREAIRLLGKAIVELEELKGPYHPDVASALSNLSAVYESRKQYTKARPLAERALAIDSQSLGAASAKVAVDLNNLGSIAFFEHRWSEAETLMNRGLSTNRRLLGDSHPETGEIAGNLAILYAKQQRYSEASPLFEMAIASREVNCGPQDLKLAKLLAMHAGVLRSVGEFSRAEQAEVRYMRIAVRNKIASN